MRFGLSSLRQVLMVQPDLPWRLKLVLVTGFLEMLIEACLACAAAILFVYLKRDEPRASVRLFDYAHPLEVLLSKGMYRLVAP